LTMSRKRTVPTKPRFALAVRGAYEVLAKIGACELPVDPFRIGDYFPEIKIVAYTELRDNTGCKDPLKFDECNARAAFLEFFSSAARMPALTPRHTRCAEKRAILWYMMTVFGKLPVCKNGEGIRDICDISDDAACKRVNELKRLPYSSYEIEETLNRNFYKYIKEDTNNLDAEAFAPSLGGLPIMYEDYAEYEYWDYVVASIGSKEKNTELCATLTNSIAIYDEGDMLIIAKHESGRVIADKHSEAILRCIQKYGIHGIETVSSISTEALELLS